MRKTVLQVTVLIVALAMILTACGPQTTPTPAATQAPVTQAPPAATQVPPTTAPTSAPFIFGMLLVGAHNDNGWSQATYDGGLYVEQQIPNSKMLYLENVYSGSPSYP